MRARAEDMAFFVVAVGMSPSDYWLLTGYQREAIYSAYVAANKAR